MRLREIAKPVWKVGKGSTLGRAASLMIEKGSDSLFVLESEKPVGVLSAFDVLAMAVKGVELGERRVEEVMCPHVLALESELTIEEGAELMLAHGRWMAGVMEQGVCTGVVTAQALLKALLTGR